ncbi:MAG: molybdate ABC transporter substrate-binding protein [Burkholderiales bacterium]
MRLAGAVGLTLATLASPLAAARVPAVAAAADLQYALTEIADAYRRSTGNEVRIAFGSSGNFARQIEHGAPFELFLSADEAYVERLVRGGLTRDGGSLYAIGRIALFVPRGSPLLADASLADLGSALRERRVKRFAIANPEHAPYGRAAREALNRAGLWDALSPVLVLGENAAQATQFAAGGEAQGGIIPWSLAKAPTVARLGTAVPLPADWHAPLRQRMVLLRTASAPAVAFHAYLGSPEARRIFARHGFALPGEAG